MMTDQEAIARTCYGEARNQGEEGMRAVANVILNRVACKTWWGLTPLEVCLKPYQFSCWLPSDPNFVKLKEVTDDDDAYATAFDIAGEAVDGALEDNTKGATHYRVIGTPAKWAVNQKPVCVIGKHEFFKLNS